jgi:prolipoprotein diacylglyceryltransferase
MFPVLQIGSIALPTAPLSLMLGVWIGAWLAEQEATRLGLSGDSIAGLLMVGLVAGLIGARLGYVAQYFGSYRAEPLGCSHPIPPRWHSAPGCWAASSPCFSTAGAITCRCGVHSTRWRLV